MIPIEKVFCERLKGLMADADIQNASQLQNELKRTEAQRADRFTAEKTKQIDEAISSFKNQLDVENDRCKPSQKLMKKKIAEITEEEDRAFGYYTSANFPRQSVYDWVDGKSVPNVKQLMTLCALFSCDPLYLLGEISTLKAENNLIHETTGLSEDAIKKLYGYYVLSREKGSIYSHMTGGNLIPDILSFFVTYYNTHKLFCSGLELITIMIHDYILVQQRISAIPPHTKELCSSAYLWTVDTFGHLNPSGYNEMLGCSEKQAAMIRAEHPEKSDAEIIEYMESCGPLFEKSDRDLLMYRITNEFQEMANKYIDTLLPRDE